MLRTADLSLGPHLEGILQDSTYIAGLARTKVFAWAAWNVPGKRGACVGQS